MLRRLINQPECRMDQRGPVIINSINFPCSHLQHKVRSRFSISISHFALTAIAYPLGDSSTNNFVLALQTLLACVALAVFRIASLHSSSPVSEGTLLLIIPAYSAAVNPQGLARNSRRLLTPRRKIAFIILLDKTIRDPH